MHSHIHFAVSNSNIRPPPSVLHSLCVFVCLWRTPSRRTTQSIDRYSGGLRTNAHKHTHPRVRIYYTFTRSDWVIHKYTQRRFVCRFNDDDADDGNGDVDGDVWCPCVASSSSSTTQRTHTQTVRRFVVPPQAPPAPPSFPMPECRSIQLIAHKHAALESFYSILLACVAMCTTSYLTPYGVYQEHHDVLTTHPKHVRTEKQTFAVVVGVGVGVGIFVAGSIRMAPDYLWRACTFLPLLSLTPLSLLPFVGRATVFFSFPLLICWQMVDA